MCLCVPFTLVCHLCGKGRGGEERGGGGDRRGEERERKEADSVRLRSHYPESGRDEGGELEEEEKEEGGGRGKREMGRGRSEKGGGRRERRR